MPRTFDALFNPFSLRLLEPLCNRFSLHPYYSGMKDPEAIAKTLSSGMVSLGASINDLLYWASCSRDSANDVIRSVASAIGRMQSFIVDISEKHMEVLRDFHEDAMGDLGVFPARRRDDPKVSANYAANSVLGIGFTALSVAFVIGVLAVTILH